jgi:hypothetical protein
MEFILSERGGQKLCTEGHCYTKKALLQTGGTSYICDRYPQCKATLVVDGLNVKRPPTDHTHAADPTRIEALKLRSTIRDRTANVIETPVETIIACVGQNEDRLGSHMPAISSIQRGIRRQRFKMMCPHPLPKARPDIRIPVEFMQTTRGEQFLLHDGGAEHKFLLFGTRQNLEILAASDHWYMDGTFSVVPPLYSQMYTIHVMHSGHHIPCIYGLLESKTMKAYESIFDIILCEINRRQPSTISIDFEIAAINAIRKKFDGVQICGCLFHFGQSIFRRVQQLGFQREYNEDIGFCMEVKMLIALAFVPHGSVISAFSHLSANLRPQLLPLLEYYEDTYIGRQIGALRKPAMFPVEIWNVYERVHEGLPRTNNALEGWHAAFLNRMRCRHPNIWKFIMKLRDEQAFSEILFQQAVIGAGESIRRKKYIDLDKRIKTIVLDFYNRSIMDYLKGIAANLSL